MSAADAFDLADAATRNAVLRAKVQRLEAENQLLRGALERCARGYDARLALRAALAGDAE
jgi:cell division protein FtsB